MKITKLGHCCLVIEENGVRTMTDPGAYSTLQNEEKKIDYIFITHEHQYHFHLESLKIVLKNNPNAKIVTNGGVGELLDVERIPYEILENGGTKDCSGMSIEGCGEKHAVIYPGFSDGDVLNTGYLFANRFFYPGDAFFNPKKAVEILALPVAGPWMKISEAIDYAKLLKPKVCFPVHDGMLKWNGTTRRAPQKLFPPLGIEFVDVAEGISKDFG
jgi:L-ascorbate metabolism protein UlaG (beta-lactamase superfamily)